MMGITETKEALESLKENIASTITQLTSLIIQEIFLANEIKNRYIVRACRPKLFELFPSFV